MNILTPLMVYLKVAKRVNPKSSHHKGKTFPLTVFFFFNPMR